MIHRFILWEVIPTLTTLFFGFFFGGSKPALLVCTIIIGVLTVSAVLDSSRYPEREEFGKKPSVVINMLTWIACLGLAVYIRWVVAQAFTRMSTVLFILVLIGGILAASLICYQISTIWKNILFFQQYEEDDEDDEEDEEDEEDDEEE